MTATVTPPTTVTGTTTKPLAVDVVKAASSDDSPRRAPQERSTRQKRALAAVLDASEGFRSAQDLYAALQAQGENIALTTVYNQVRALAEAGELDALRGEDGETRYRRCASDEHHHHLVCRQCGSAIEVEGPEVERWATRTGNEHGYVDVTHTVEILGTCPDCAAATRRLVRPAPAVLPRR
jgi:Fur family transcriptional regulator, ferric uptake regulator